MSKKRISIIVLIVAAVILLPPLLVPKVSPWSEINCCHQDINVKTGQARYSRLLWFITISQRIEDTPLSLALQGETVDVSTVEAWHRVNTFSPGIHHSPHYRYHGALFQAHQIEMIDSDPKHQKEIARDILSAWQESGTYFGADRWLNKLLEEGSSNKGLQGTPLRVGHEP